MKVWIAVAVVGAGTIAMKGLGPALLGGRRLPDRVANLAILLAPTLLGALVVTQTLGAPTGWTSTRGWSASAQPPSPWHFAHR